MPPGTYSQPLLASVIIYLEVCKKLADVRTALQVGQQSHLSIGVRLGVLGRLSGDVRGVLANIRAPEDQDMLAKLQGLK